MTRNVVTSFFSQSVKNTSNTNDTNELQEVTKKVTPKLHSNENNFFEACFREKPVTVTDL